MTALRGRLLALGGLVGIAVLVVTGLVGRAPAPTSEANDPGGTSESGGGDPGASDDAPQVQQVAPSRAQRVGSVQARPPAAVRLPGTGFLDVTAVGTRANGILDVPDDVDRLGWWEGGARVGDPFGSVLVAGHVDSEEEGLGPSARLLTTARGDQVVVRTTGGSQARTVRYDVVSRTLVPLDDLASYPRVLSSRGPARLTLVTCAPPFVPDAGGYQNLAVVTARPADRGDDRTGGRR